MPLVRPSGRMLDATFRPIPSSKHLRSSTCIRGFSTSHRSKSSPNSSVNPHEVSHFDALASTWWDAQGSSRLLHLMNPLRHKFISSCVSSQFDPLPSTSRLKYLDVGCGGGIFAETAARLRNTESVTAIDPSAEVLGVARAHARRDPLLKPPRLRYEQASVEDLPLPATVEDGYDIVTIFEVIEHVNSPAAVLDALSNHVKPGGWIILSTIARTWTSWLTTKFVAEDVIRMVPQGTHDWAKYINVDELRGWFETGPQRGEWENLKAAGVIYVPGIGWKEVQGSEEYGNYFFGARKKPVRND